MKDTIVCTKFTLRKLRPVEDKKSIIENINDKDVLKNLYFDFEFNDEKLEIIKRIKWFKLFILLYLY